ncbi:30S ribosomal protein S17e [Candidatus Woesearchaeota archaeon]|nr:30S ribosomal protein S17e [Candidatus Woesearchaeota archaeon]
MKETMGRIKTTPIKRKAREMMITHGEEFSGDFKGNKDVLHKHFVIKSKKLRNVLGGLITKLKKRGK